MSLICDSQSPPCIVLQTSGLPLMYVPILEFVPLFGKFGGLEQGSLSYKVKISESEVRPESASSPTTRSMKDSVFEEKMFYIL